MNVPREVEPARPRVLLLSEHLPDEDALGGVEIHVADLAASLAPEVEAFAAHLRAGRLIVEAFRPERRELAALDAADLSSALETALLALEIDVFHVHSPQIGPEAVARAARASAAALVLTLHDHWLERLRAERLVGTAACFIAPSRFVRDSLARSYPRIASETRTMAWGVPPQTRVPLGRGGPLRIGVVGVLARDKGAERLPFLMRAAARFGAEWHLFGATEGRSLREIRRAAPHVRAHGSYRRDELGALLAKAEIDVVLLPSIFLESFSMALSECVAATVPVIASDLGALAERVEELRAGWLFDPWRAESFVEVLEPLGDRVELARIKAHLETLSPRTPTQMAADHAALYRELVEKRAAGEPPAPDADRRRAARQRFDASPPRGSRALRRLWHVVRRSRFYRELPLRRLLPEALRAGLERRAARLLDRLKR